MCIGNQINNKKEMETKLLRVHEVQEILGVTRMTIHNYSKKGILKPKKIGGTVYFKKSDIEELIN